jgi:uncharacterized Ntn-hydrolase superfamily protein
MKSRTLLFIAFMSAISLQAQDTFSITAIDTVTGEVGSAGASCIGAPQIPSGCFILSDVKPGLGVIHTQAYYLSQNQNYASSLMDQGIHPEDIIDSLVANDYQNNPHIRQYGIIDFVDGEVRRAAYTGINCDDYKNHILGPNYTIQGNILLGQEILDSMEARFLNTEGELACKLMAALQGAKVIGADTRCLDDGVSSLSAFLRVAQPLDLPYNLYLNLNIPSTPEGVDPIDSLQTLIDLWGGCYISGLEPKTNGFNVTINPNPSSGGAVIRCNNCEINDGKITLLNAQGQVVFEQKNLYGKEIDLLQTLPSGIYLYQLTDRQGLKAQGKLLVR